MRWVTVASEQGPRACGCGEWQVCRCQRGRSRDARRRVRELLELGTDWQRRAWAALHGVGSCATIRPTSSCWRRCPTPARSFASG